jgi:hypothetical protein
MSKKEDGPKTPAQQIKEQMDQHIGQNPHACIIVSIGTAGARCSVVSGTAEQSTFMANFITRMINKQLDADDAAFQRAAELRDSEKDVTKLQSI